MFCLIGGFRANAFFERTLRVLVVYSRRVICSTAMKTGINIRVGTLLAQARTRTSPIISACRRKKCQPFLQLYTVRDVAVVVAAGRHRISRKRIYGGEERFVVVAPVEYAG